MTPQSTSPLVPKLLLGNAPVLEAPLPCARQPEQPPTFAGAAEQSFGDKGVSKQELGHEGHASVDVLGAAS